MEEKSQQDTTHPLAQPRSPEPRSLNVDGQGEVLYGRLIDDTAPGGLIYVRDAHLPTPEVVAQTGLRLLYASQPLRSPQLSREAFALYEKPERGMALERDEELTKLIRARIQAVSALVNSDKGQATRETQPIDRDLSKDLDPERGMVDEGAPSSEPDPIAAAFKAWPNLEKWLTDEMSREFPLRTRRVAIREALRQRRERFVQQAQSFLESGRHREAAERLIWAAGVTLRMRLDARMPFRLVVSGVRRWLEDAAQQALRAGDAQRAMRLWEFSQHTGTFVRRFWTERPVEDIRLGPEHGMARSLNDRGSVVERTPAWELLGMFGLFGWSTMPHELRFSLALVGAAWLIWRILTVSNTEIINQLLLNSNLSDGEFRSRMKSVHLLSLEI